MKAAARAVEPAGRAAPAAPVACFFAQRFPPDVSGAGLQIRRVAARLVAAGVPVQVVALSSLPAADAAEDGLPVSRIAVERSTPRRRRGTTRRVLAELHRRRRGMAVLLLSGLSRLTFLLLLWGRLSGVPVVFRAAMLGADDPQAIAQSRFGAAKLALLGCARGFVATTPRLQRLFAERYGAARVHLIHNGVDTGLFRPVASPAEKLALRRRLGLAPEARIVITNGVICARKRTLLMLEAIAALAPRIADLQFVHLGAGQRDFAERDVAYCERALSLAAGIRPGLVHFVEHTPEVQDYLKAADLFVFASRREGCPNAVLEALAAGLPVVMTALPGVSDFVIGDGVEGLVVADATDPAALADAVLALLLDDRRRAACGAAARARALATFALERSVEGYRTLLERVGRASPATPAPPRQRR